ncbi:MAG: hypothetical protein ABI686_00490 [Acidobacteriota bacterium]
MFWEEWDADEAYWYAPMKIGSGRDFSLLIRADSLTDFMTVGGTHSTYQRLLENLNSLRDEMVGEIMENSRGFFKKKRQQISAGGILKKSLQLFSIKIYADLSSEISFIGETAEDEDPDETFYALIDPDGTLTEAGNEES